MTQLDLFESEKELKRKQLLKRLKEEKNRRQKKKRVKGVKL